MAHYLIPLQKFSDVKFVFIIMSFLVLIFDVSGQNDSLKNRKDSVPGRSYLIQKVERNGVIMPEVEIKEVTVVAKPGVAKRSEYRKYDRLIYNIKRVYPYAMMVRIRLSQVNEELRNIPTEKARREYIKNVEKDVFGEYEDDMRRMTINQGRLLIKLIDRETQNTSFELIREYRGKFSAAFWQGIARIFGTNLKEEYDPFGEDALIELIINAIEEGRI